MALEVVFQFAAGFPHAVTFESIHSFFLRQTDATFVRWKLNEDRVALGRYQPRAPTDPYVPALEHTVPQITVSLRNEAENGLRALGPMGIVARDRETSPTSSCECGCGG